MSAAPMTVLESLAPRPSSERVDVLLVDDRAEDLLGLSAVLETSAYSLVTARSGSEALRNLLERDFAVILIDILMPTMDGFELATLIKQRERNRDTPIIFLTAAGSDVSKIYRGYSVGAVDYLPKPVDADVLRAKVGIFAELFRRARRLEQQGRALQEAERRERELQLAELRLTAERRYLNLAEAIPQIVWTADHHGALRYTNQRWIDYTGLSLERARDDGWLAAVHEDDRDATRKAWRSAVDQGAVYEGEFRLERESDHHHRWHLARAVPERDDTGRIVAWLGTATDCEELKQALDARDEFLSIASHELRTPLAALKLRVQSLLRDRTLDGKFGKKLESVERQTNRLERLIDNLLDVSRITTGHLELDREVTDLGELASEVVDRLRDEATAIGCEIAVDAAPHVTGQWDRMRLEQVVTNLVSNALRYGDAKPVTVRVGSNGADAELSVEDRGPGISEDDRERIFDKFERAAIRRAPGGLGMGLYITRQIVTAHGGDVRVRSEPGIGSTFSVSLPRELREHFEQR